MRLLFLHTCFVLRGPLVFREIGLISNRSYYNFSLVLNAIRAAEWSELVARLSSIFSIRFGDAASDGRVIIQVSTLRDQDFALAICSDYTHTTLVSDLKSTDFTTVFEIAILIIIFFAPLTIL